jgi:glutathione peroxidase-family protein
MMDKVSVKGDNIKVKCISFDKKIKKTDYRFDVEWNFQKYLLMKRGIRKVFLQKHRQISVVD